MGGQKVGNNAKPNSAPPPRPPTNHADSDPPPPASPNAYFFLVGGVHESRPSYKGFLYGVLVAVRVLRRLGSTSDFVLRIQLSPNSTLSELPDEDARPLKSEGVRIHYTDRSAAGEGESFGQLVHDKLWPVRMTEYKRVMFLDADVLPLVNLDYLFQLSDQSEGNDQNEPVLRPNMIYASRGEPCNAGLFILEPKEGSWERVLQIIDEQHERGAKLPYPHFDKRVGWGHDFVAEGDFWESVQKKDARWNYHASHSDQGLLYYWVKYVVMDVSIAIGNRLQNWVPGDDGKHPKLASETTDALEKYSPQPLAKQMGMEHLQHPPYRDFVHFMGGDKPWQKGPIFKPTSKLWFEELAKANVEHGLGLDVEQWNEKHRPMMSESPLGAMALHRDLAKLYES